jgi:anti-sigma-K factor RskA
MSLSIERFSELLDAYGADLARWPSAASLSAAQLLVDSDAARQRLQLARELDAALQLPSPAAPSPWLRQRILARAGSLSAQRATGYGWRELFAELGGWRLAGPSLAVALSLGVALGLGLGLEQLEIDQQPADLVALLQLDDEDLEY